MKMIPWNVYAEYFVYNPKENDDRGLTIYTGRPYKGGMYSGDYEMITYETGSIGTGTWSLNSGNDLKVGKQWEPSNEYIRGAIISFFKYGIKGLA